MALLDLEQQCVVVRVVYDGPAFAGKTTNLEALGRLFGLDVFSGEGTDGRTLYLDWLDYVGGNFDGMPVRCQIVAVPGQRVFEERRRLLLETADAIVFVADSRPDRLTENIRAFGLLREVVDAMDPVVGIVAQANQRDTPDATSLEAMRGALDGGPSLALTEAVATRGEGVRETFAFAVRLALDRVRALQTTGALPESKPQIETGAQLQDALKAVERGEAVPLGDSGDGAGRDVANRQQRAARKAWNIRGGRPSLPDTSAPARSIWPPIEGRVTLHEASRVVPDQERNQDGDWLAFGPDWQWCAPFEGLFFDSDEARTTLLNWARWHAAAEQRLSGPRCIVLRQEAADVWRLWQVVRRVETLRERIEALLHGPDDSLGESLIEIIDCRLRAERDWVATDWVGALDFDTISLSPSGSPHYAGFAPLPAISPPVTGAEVDEQSLLRDKLVPQLRRELARAPHRMSAVLDVLNRAGRGDDDGVAATIRRLLLAH